MNRKTAAKILKSMTITDPKEAEAIQSAIEIIEETIYHRWHYLDRNPDDLPEVGKEVIYIFTFPYKKKARKMATNTGIYDGPEFFQEFDGFVFKAWKYVEKSNYDKY